MSQTRWRLATAAIAVAGLLGGCAQVISGNGQFSSGLAAVPDANVQINGTDGGPIDKLAGNAISDIQEYWTKEMPLVFGKPYRPPGGFFSIDPGGTQPAPCTNSAADIRGNAFYCPAQNIVAWDRVTLFPTLERTTPSSTRRPCRAPARSWSSPRPTATPGPGPRTR